MEGSYQQNTARSHADTLYLSNMNQRLEKGAKKKRNKFWQHSKLFGVVKTGKVQGCAEGYSETE